MLRWRGAGAGRPGGGARGGLSFSADAHIRHSFCSTCYSFCSKFGVSVRRHLRLPRRLIYTANRFHTRLATTPLNGKDLCFRKPHLSDPKASDREINRARAALGEAEE